MSELATKRLTKEYIGLEKERVELVKAVRPLDSNLHECHFCVSLLYNFFNKNYTHHIKA